MINLLIRLFMVLWCFVFVLAEDRMPQNSTIIMKNIGFESRNIKFNISYCNSRSCKSGGNYSYLVKDKLKNNMEILAYKHLINKNKNNIFVKTNGLRVMRGDEVISKYYKGIGLMRGNYDDYFSYKKMLLRYLDRVKKPINDISMKYYKLNPLMYNVYFPKIKGSIIITRTKTNNNLYFYNTKMNIIVSPIIAVSDLSGDEYIKNIVNIDKFISLDSNTLAGRDDWNDIFDNLMQNISSEISYDLANMEMDGQAINSDDEQSASVFDDEEDYISPPTFKDDINNNILPNKSSHFFTLGVSAIPIKASLGLEYKFPNSYSHYFNSFSFGYSKNMLEWYDVAVNINMNIGKKDYLIIDGTYAFKQPTLLLLNASLSKRMYLNSNIYIAPLLSGSISKISSSGVKGFKNSSYLQNYNISLGGEVGLSRDNHEIALWVKKSLNNTSNIVDGDKKYKATVDNGVLFGLSYGYSF